MSDGSFGIVSLYAYLLGTLIVILLPGPNSLYVLATASQRGVRAGYRAAAGVFLGDLALMLAAMLGVSSLLKAYPALFVIFKYAGGGYLVYLGAGMIVSAWRGLAGPGDAPAVEAPANPAVRAVQDPLRRALFISLLNPKAILFWMAFFIQFVDPAYPHKALSFALLGVMAQAMSMAYLSVLIVGGVRLADAFRRRRRLSAGLKGSAGALFIGFGAKLATATVN
jgi:leucine efflux protein